MDGDYYSWFLIQRCMIEDSNNMQGEKRSKQETLYFKSPAFCFSFSKEIIKILTPFNIMNIVVLSFICSLIGFYLPSPLTFLNSLLNSVLGLHAEEMLGNKIHIIKLHIYPI